MITFTHISLQPKFHYFYPYFFIPQFSLLLQHFSKQLSFDNFPTYLPHFRSSRCFESHINSIGIDRAINAITTERIFSASRWMKILNLCESLFFAYSSRTFYQKQNSSKFDIYLYTQMGKPNLYIWVYRFFPGNNSMVRFEGISVKHDC